MDTSQIPRARIPNPNHATPASSSISLGPSTRQPAPQQPHFHRDPFRPNPQPEKRDVSTPGAPFWQANGPPASYPQARPLDPRDTLQPAPAPPPSPFSRNAPFRSEHSRHPSQSGDTATDSASASYTVPPFTSTRNMPPPASSPPQAPQSDLSNPPHRGQLPKSSSYGPLRDQPSRQMGRSSNNMSISSVLGSDTTTGPTAPAWSPQSKHTTHSSGYRPPVSPYRGSLTTSNEDHKTTEYWAPQYGPMFPVAQHAVSVQNGPLASPNRSKLGLSNILLAPYSVSPTTSPLPPRPYSQPVRLDAREAEGKTNIGAGEFQRRDIKDYHSGRHTISDEHQRGRSSDRRSRDRAVSDLSPRNAPGSFQIQASSAYGPDEYAQVSEHSRAQWHRPDTIDMRDPDRPIASREGPQLPQEVFYGPHLPTGLLQQEENLRITNGQALYGPPPAARAQAYTGMPPFAVQESSPSKMPFLEQHLRRSLDDSQAPGRPLFGFPYDSTRRLERASPLPQAVQGASSQPVGSRRDPSIKSEFTRVFSGLGSGVGSTPIPTAPTESPTPARHVAGIVNGVEDQAQDLRRHNESARGFATKPRAERRVKRTYDIDGKADSDTESRKRKTVAHHHHHHHHGLNGPRPHHHHLKTDDGTSAALHGRQSSVTPLNASRASAGPANILSNRHHHHNVHHHHHNTQNSPTPVAAFRRPLVTIQTQPLLQSVAHQPRSHLGSQLHAPTVSLPPSRATPLYTRHPFASRPRPLPNFGGKENCTFTIRVPRAYLSHASREHLCAQRQVWGTDVYTDDSDPLAAAVHSGWIRGAWSEDVDVNLLELNIGQPAPQDGIVGNQSVTHEAQTKSTDTLTNTPATGPVTPPENRDAYITLLVLPPLEKYASSTWYGIRSRSWGDNHDGMSFKIHRIEWVNGSGMIELEQKGTRARNQRLLERQKAAKRLRVAPVFAKRDLVKVAPVGA